MNGRRLCLDWIDAELNAQSAQYLLSVDPVFVCVKSADFSRWERADARARLLERIMVSERERAEGLHEDMLGASRDIRAKYGL